MRAHMEWFTREGARRQRLRYDDHLGLLGIFPSNAIFMQVALKQIRLDLKKEGMSISVIREINSLFTLRHENLVRLYDVAVGRRLHKIFLVMEYCEQDLATLLDNMQNKFTEGQVKCILKQLFEGMKYLHDSFIIHRDVKVGRVVFGWWQS